MCDRCKATSNAGDIDDPPPNWRFTPMPVRGSQGARSTRDAVICDDCDDSLYRWMVDPPIELTTAPVSCVWDTGVIHTRRQTPAGETS